MTAEDQNTPTARAAETLRRGPGAAPAPGRTPRGLMRRLLLRALRPYTHHQHELDATIVAALRHQQAGLDRHAEQIERLEELARELILTAESLRRTSADAARDADGAIATAELRSKRSSRSRPSCTRRRIWPTARSRSCRRRWERSWAIARRAGLSDGGGQHDDYVAFEQLFRGPAERVAELQRPYLALVRDHEPVLDVGCGRGEFLTLLASEGIAARGVDSDAGMVARCRELGLDVERGDANEHLDGLPDGSLGTVFSAQVIEHLPHAELHRLLELSLRKLAPGGLFIAETVNPHRISSLKTFWVDLTHQHPIFPEVALAICAIAGFHSAYVFAPGFDSFEEASFDSPAYAVVAAAPMTGAERDAADADSYPRHAARRCPRRGCWPLRCVATSPTGRYEVLFVGRERTQAPARAVAAVVVVALAAAGNHGCARSPTSSTMSTSRALIARHEEEDLIALLLPRVLRAYSERGAGPVLHLPPTAWVLGDLAPVASGARRRAACCWSRG